LEISSTLPVSPALVLRDSKRDANELPDK